MEDSPWETDALETIEATATNVYRWGHVGSALLLYGPVGGLLRWGGEPGLAALGAAIAVACSTLPDVDEHLHIEHRGPTHTIWFALAVGVGVAVIGVSLGAAFERPVATAATTGVAAGLSLGSHVLADSITPMGIRPLYPLSGWHHTFDITPAESSRANAALLALGVAVALLCQVLVVTTL